jgi:hypothetical protein
VVSEQEVAEYCLDANSHPESDVWRLFLYAMKSPVTRDKYQRRLLSYFEYAKVEGDSLRTKALSFIRMATREPSWPFNVTLRFIEVQNARVSKREISGATVRNYHFQIQFFSNPEMLRPDKLLDLLS